MADWSKIKSRGKVSDKRGLGSTAGIGGMALNGGSLVTIGIILLISYFAGGGVDLGQTLEQLNNAQPQSQTQSSAEQPEEFKGEDEYELFTSQVLGSNNDFWREIFESNNLNYIEPEIVLFNQPIASGCGSARPEMGPHYCPLDNKIYLDRGFFELIETRFKAQGGDVAEAYVIGHEVGHHIQKELGIMDQVRSEQRSNPDEANDLSVRQELQADCFAGVWANSIRDAGIFESDQEIEEAISVAAAIGDDRIQETSGQRVNPESWTHGSSDQRVEWFKKGWDQGDPNSCDTF